MENKIKELISQMTVEEKIGQLNMEFITLEVRQSNTPAINLYQSFGFEPVGKRPKFYSHPTEDALLLTKYFIKG